MRDWQGHGSQKGMPAGLRVDEALQFLSNGGGDDEVCIGNFAAVGGDRDGFGARGFGSGETAAGAIEFVKSVEPFRLR